MVLFFLILFCLLIQAANSPAAQTEKEGRIQGDEFVNLRSGPGLEHPPRAVLKRGEEVTVRAEEKGWYRVSLSDHRTGYVSREFVSFTETGTQETPQEVPEEASPAKSGVVTAEEKETETEILSPQQENSPVPQSNPWLGLRAIEGKEREIFTWLLAALCIFIIGWICGGNYYLRRDRVKRTKLHF